MCTRSADGDGVARRGRDLRAERLERARLRLGAVPHRHRRRRAAASLRPSRRPTTLFRETPHSPSPPPVRIYPSAPRVRSSACFAELGAAGRVVSALTVAVAAVGAAEACCAGPAMPRAARRSSRPIRRIPIGVVGFDVEIADAASRAGSAARREFVNVTFTSIDQSIARGDADIGLSGIEDTPARRADAGGRRFPTTSSAKC